MVTGLDFAAHAEVIAEKAAEIARGYFRGQLHVELKADESPVTQADKAVEEMVRDYLAEHFSDHGILGEEHGTKHGDSRYLWVVDPIDGTRSFLTGHPLFGFLLALLDNGDPILGIIGAPALRETLIGIPGKGTTLNGSAIRVSGQTRLDAARLFVNEGEKIYRDHPTVFDRLMGCGQTRRLGYDCYPHALVAMGHVDAVVDYDLQPYDYMALSAVVRAAGGQITDWQGNPLTLASDGRVVSAASPELHRDLLNLLNG